MTTLNDVARKVGVSVATVSYVLNDTGSVSQKVREKVLIAVEQLGYRPNRKAQAMRTGFTNSIGLILPDLTNPFFPELAQKVENAARNAGLTVLLFDTQNQKDAESEGFKMLEQHGVDGIIWCPVDSDTPTANPQAKCPVVVIDRPIPGYDIIQSDYRKGGCLLAGHALDLGHKNVGLLSGPANIESAKQRRQGFLEAAENLSIQWDIEVPFSTSLSKEAIDALQAGGVSMVVCADDLIAISAMRILEDSGLNVPGDVSVVGFDNMPWSEYVKPKLTTINQPVGDIGSQAVVLLTEKIKNPEEQVACETTVLDVELIVRESSAAL